jgi:hypothetical protein
LPIFLFILARMAIQNFTAFKYRLGLNWILLEVTPPKEFRRSPKAMEQVFTGLHGIYSVPVKWSDQLFKGKIPDWYSFEMVGKGGETHFYIRTIDKYKNIVESQVYAQYPEAEIVEVEDYVNELPLYLPDDKYDLWGTELLLNKEDTYPIRTYPDFEEKAVGPDDVKRLDPLSSLSELFSTLHPDEHIWIQILGAPTGDGWIKKGQATLDKLMGKEPAPAKGGFLSDAIFSIDKAITSIGSNSEDVVEKKEKKERVDVSPGKQDIMKSIEKSWDKLGFETSIRFIYIGPKDAFHQAHVAGISGAFRQFSSQNLNGFKVNRFSITHTKGLFKKSKLLTRKRAIYQSYKERKMPLMKFVLNTEELATVYHFPDIGVKSPLIPRVEAKKGEPPVGLPTI